MSPIEKTNSTPKLNDKPAGRNTVDKEVHRSSYKKQGNTGKSSNRKKEEFKKLGKPTQDEMLNMIKSLNGELRRYSVRELVKHSEKLGQYLWSEGIETNQIRKFLDAINRIKAKQIHEQEAVFFKSLETDLILLKPKLAYAVGRADKKKKPAFEILNTVLSASIDAIPEVDRSLENEVLEEAIRSSKESFERFTQLIEAIVAYHKSEGGK